MVEMQMGIRIFDSSEVLTRKKNQARNQIYVTIDNRNRI